MAKKKGGLGRGLNSLIGESLGETSTAPVSTEKQEEKVENPSLVASNTKKQQKPDASEIINPEKDPKPQPYFEEDDHISIKGVSYREVTKPSFSNFVSEKKETQADIEDIYPNPDQPRTFFKKEELEELAASIKRDGLLQPILVRRIPEGYQIIAGERRYQACRLLNLDTVPIIVREVDDNEAIELALVENIQRADLNPIEEAYGYKRLIERRGMTQTEVAQAVSKGRSTIANSLRLLELPEEAQQLLYEEKITAGHARAILSVQSPDGRQKLTDKLVAEKLSVREAEAIARLLNGQAKASEAPKKQPAPDYFKKMAKTLRKKMNTNVRIKSVKGKNKVEIEFVDEDDLNRLFAAIVSKE